MRPSSLHSQVSISGSLLRPFGKPYSFRSPRFGQSESPTDTTTNTTGQQLLKAVYAPVSKVESVRLTVHMLSNILKEPSSTRRYLEERREYSLRQRYEACQRYLEFCKDATLSIRESMQAYRMRTEKSLVNKQPRFLLQQILLLEMVALGKTFEEVKAVLLTQPRPTTKRLMRLSERNQRENGGYYITPELINLNLPKANRTED